MVLSLDLKLENLRRVLVIGLMLETMFKFNYFLLFFFEI
jgi:hypothetical protein